MKRSFYTTRPRKIQGFNVGRQVLVSPRGNPMEANLKHLQFMLTKIFTFPRNHQFDKVSASTTLQHNPFENNLITEFKIKAKRKYKFLHLEKIWYVELPFWCSVVQTKSI